MAVVTCHTICHCQEKFSCTIFNFLFLQWYATIRHSGALHHQTKPASSTSTPRSWIQVPAIEMSLDLSCLHIPLHVQPPTRVWISPCSCLLPHRVQVKTFCFFLHIPLERLLDEVPHQLSMGAGQARQSLLQLPQHCQVFAFHLAVSCLQAGTLMGKQKGISWLTDSSSCIDTALSWSARHIKWRFPNSKAPEDTCNNFVQPVEMQPWCNCIQSNEQVQAAVASMQQKLLIEWDTYYSITYFSYCMHQWIAISRLAHLRSQSKSHYCSSVLCILFPYFLDKFSAMHWTVSWQNIPLLDLSYDHTTFRIHGSNIDKVTTCPSAMSVPWHQYTTLLMDRKPNWVKITRQSLPHPDSWAYKEGKRNWDGYPHSTSGELRPQVKRLTQSLRGSSVKTPAQWKAAVENKTETIRENEGAWRGGRKEHGIQYFASHWTCWSDYFLKVRAVSGLEKDNKLEGR